MLKSQFKMGHNFSFSGKDHGPRVFVKTRPKIDFKRWDNNQLGLTDIKISHTRFHCAKETRDHYCVRPLIVRVYDIHHCQSVRGNPTILVTVSKHALSHKPLVGEATTFSRRCDCKHDIFSRDLIGQA